MSLGVLTMNNCVDAMMSQDHPTTELMEMGNGIKMSQPQLMVACDAVKQSSQSETIRLAVSECEPAFRNEFNDTTPATTTTTTVSSHAQYENSTTVRPLPGGQSRYTLAHSVQNSELGQLLSRGKTEVVESVGRSDQGVMTPTERRDSIDASQIVEPTGRLNLGGSDYPEVETAPAAAAAWACPVKSERVQPGPFKEQTQPLVKDLGSLSFKVEPMPLDSFGGWGQKATDPRLLTSASPFSLSTPTGSGTVTSCAETKFTLAPSKLQSSGPVQGTSLSCYNQTTAGSISSGQVASFQPADPLCSSHRGSTVVSCQSQQQQQQTCTIFPDSSAARAPFQTSPPADFFPGAKHEVPANPNPEVLAAYAFDQKPAAPVVLDPALQSLPSKVNCEASKDLDLEGLGKQFKRGL